MGLFSSIGGFIRRTGEKIKEKVEKAKEVIKEAIDLFGLKKMKLRQGHLSKMHTMKKLQILQKQNV